MIVQADWFKDWFNSPYYHQLYFESRNKEAENFIDTILNKLQPPAGSLMLDVGCGRGSISQYLSIKGFDVTGIDLSFESIDAARKSETDTLHFFQHDMRLPFWVNYFDYAINLFANFGFYKSEREHYNAIRTIAQSLKNEGRLVIDYLNLHFAEDHLVHKSEKEVNDVCFYITKWYDETHFYKKIVIEDERLQEPLVYQEKLAKFSLGDFTDMLAFHELQIQEVYGDYDLSNYDLKKSPRLIVIAKKLSR